MERDCGPFMVMPPPQRQYDEAAAGQQLMRQLMVAAGEAGAGRGGGDGDRKRRFTEEQVRSLETTFHARRAKLEPREKAELARELGLQPRQVAIWFQNKRARWRSKQLEHDYAALRERYDALHARVEALKQDKLALAAQLDELRGRLSERQDYQSGSCEVNGAEEKRNNSSSTLAQEDSAAATPAVASSESTAADNYYDHVVAYDALPEPFCATPDLWDTWPLLEWNAVA
ncbi:hypothetical protein BS78_04G213200 [Paspalum vaginatum]|nr:hypothetical protein BS78_04G213200 [Paspalum vaginatum]